MRYARKTTTQSSPDQIDMATKVIQEQVIPAAGKVPGFLGGYWLADLNTGRGIGFTFFDSKASLEASRAKADEIRTEAVHMIGADVVSVEHHEVVAKTGDKIHSTAGFARVIEFSHEPSQLQAVVDRINDAVIPQARKLPGFQGGFWIADRATGKGTGVTLYDSMENLEASLSTVNQIRQESAQQTGATVGESSHYQIIARAGA